MAPIFLGTLSTCLTIGRRRTDNPYEGVQLRCLGGDLYRMGQAWQEGHDDQYKRERILFAEVARITGIDRDPVALVGWLFDLVAWVHDGHIVPPIERQRALYFVDEVLRLHQADTKDLEDHSSVQ